MLLLYNVQNTATRIPSTSKAGGRLKNTTFVLKKERINIRYPVN